MINRALILSEQYCDADPRSGPTNSDSILTGALLSTGLVRDSRIFYYDSVCNEVGLDGMIQRFDGACERYEPQVIVYSPIGGPLGMRYNPLDLRPGSARLFRGIKERGAVIYSHLWDTVGQDQEVLSRNLPFSDYIGVADGTAMRFGGDRRILQAYATVNPGQHRNHGWDRDIDVSFVGAVDPSGRRWPQRAYYINELRARGIDVVVAGGQRQGRIPWGEYIGILNRSRISLNFSLSPPMNTCQIKGRVFEILHCGAMLMEERATETQRFFYPARDYADFGCVDEAADRIRYYLDHEEERSAIAHSGWERATSIYNPTNLWGYLFEEMGFRVPDELANDACYRKHRLMINRVRTMGTAW